MTFTKSQTTINELDDSHDTSALPVNTDEKEISNEEETAPCCGCCGG
ncbi:hypothetical protein [Wohlfahrtiimonas larvae]|uniref:CCGSCS motif protein n=1 Tax=Wohlfahrtiimonas larvae TaxID=1157986 RepID=A0ABP9MJ87_9GAMM|nr:hypothetical protein [Wohlfahrtiimonas larvae]